MTPSFVRTTPPREAGNALVLTTVLGILAMAVWALAFRATLDSIRMERYVLARAERDASVTSALARALALLRTGEPPSDPYACIFTIDDGDTSHLVTARFESTGDADTWNVETSPASEADILDHPDAPETFAE